jgi:hypothetical protein
MIRDMEVSVPEGHAVYVVSVDYDDVLVIQGVDVVRFDAGDIYFDDIYAPDVYGEISSIRVYPYPDPRS